MQNLMWSIEAQSQFCAPELSQLPDIHAVLGFISCFGLAENSNYSLDQIYHQANELEKWVPLDTGNDRQTNIHAQAVVDIS